MKWDLSEAGLVCRDLGFPGAVSATHGSKFGFTPATIWMDNLYCHGTEAKLHRCRCVGVTVSHVAHMSAAAGLTAGECTTATARRRLG